MSTKLGFKVACLALAAIAAVSLASTAEATPVTYNFTVSVTSGPQSGNTETGSFSYDSSSVTPGSTNSSSGLLTAFDFTFGGIDYTADTANTGALGFDSTGALNYFFISSSCPSCEFGPDIFTLTPGSNGFLYTTATADAYYGDVTYARSGVVPVPEPDTFGLFGFGLLLLGVAAWRRSMARR